MLTCLQSHKVSNNTLTQLALISVRRCSNILTFNTKAMSCKFCKPIMAKGQPECAVILLTRHILKHSNVHNVQSSVAFKFGACFSNEWHSKNYYSNSTLHFPLRGMLQLNDIRYFVPLTYLSRVHILNAIAISQ